jgi:hypothetical protein
MTQFIPYAIIAGVVIVFFLVCYIFFSNSSGSKQKKVKAEEHVLSAAEAEQRAAWATQKSPVTKKQDEPVPDTMPVPKISNVKVRDRQENPTETEFVTTKGEAVRRNGQVVYKRRSEKRGEALPDDFEATRVLSRDEVLAAMREVDEKEKKGSQKRTDASTAPLSGMADIIAADIAEKDSRPAVKTTPAVAPVMPATTKEVSTQQKSVPPVMEPVVESDVKSMAESIEEPAVEPVAESVSEPATPESLEETRRMEPVRTRTMGADGTLKRESSAAAILEQTRRMEPVHVDTVDSQETQEKSEAEDFAVQEGIRSNLSPWGNDLTISGNVRTDTASVWDKADTESDIPVEQLCASHFLDHYGIVTSKVRQQVQNITAAAFRKVGCAANKEKEDLLDSLIIQEALQDVQKAYASHPDDYVAAMALRAFWDIVNKPQTTTRHLVAVDALKVMPYLTKGHYQILALLLLFLYSRNSHNTDTSAFRQYVNKYVAPFMDKIPTERSYFQQLDYLRCTALESKETRFADILADSYPLLFRYRGFTEEELRTILKGQRIAGSSIVQSFNSPLYKLALVDESMAARFFRKTGIADRELQDHLLRLAKKRPTSFKGEETLDVLEDISPMLADLADVWDSTLLRVSTLSLLGLYLAQGYVKEAIGEEFDLSRWFE